VQGRQRKAVRVLLFLLTVIVFAVAVRLGLEGPSMAELEDACAKTCAAEGFPSYEFKRPGTGGPRDQVVPEPCRCLR
jgi:hypothetical protein